jgi:Flp pilus assembly protein TadG
MPNLRQTPRSWRPIRLLSRLRRADRGAVSILFALMAPMMVAALTGGVDVIRYHVAQSEMQNALDVAVLSAGSNLKRYTPLSGTNLTQWTADATNYFKTNLPASYLHLTLANDNPTVTAATVTGVGQTVSMSATASLPMISTGFLGVSAMPISVSNQATVQNQSNVEVVLVLDNTGSMSDPSSSSDSTSKMQGLKTAALSFVNQFYGSGTGNDKCSGAVTSASSNGLATLVCMGLVPFTTTVNVGTTTQAKSWLTTNPYSSWNGCMIEPRDSNGYLAASVYNPAKNPFPAYGFAYYDVASFLTYLRSGPTYGCITTPVTFMTSDSSVLNTSINAMSASGSTMIPVGMLWGWRMLSSGWSGNNGWDPNRPNLPASGSSFTNLKRVMIVLSDGNNDVGSFDTNNGISGNGTASLSTPTMTYPNSKTTLKSASASTDPDVDAWQLGLCSAIRADGVEVYTITFGSDADTATMSSCATQDGAHFYAAPSNAQLTGIFNQIAGSLTTLRLIK